MLRHFSRLFGLLLVVSGSAFAHEGHEHDKPPPLNLPVAPRVISVTPDYELVGIRSGQQRLTIFLHRFATGEPVEGAGLQVSVGDDTRSAKPSGPGVFEFEATWVSVPGDHDITFGLTVPDGEDLLAGTLSIPTSAASTATDPNSWFQSPKTLVVGLGGLVAGILLTFLFTGRKNSTESGNLASVAPQKERVESANHVQQLKRVSGVLCALVLASTMPEAAKAAETILPAIPSTMATDMPQRLPDATLFVPKSTQHLISLRTVVTAQADAPRSVELAGTIIAAPDNVSRIQAERPGRLEAPDEGLAFLGKSVKKGELLGYVVPFMDSFDRATIESQIAETEGRIAQQSAILERYRERPGAVPQVKMDEVAGELEALRKRRSELLPSREQRDAITAPIDGVVSVANVSVGQVVDVRDILFEIINPSEFWVEAVAYDPTIMDTFDSAAVVASDGSAQAVEFIGKGLILRQQATPLSFRFPKTPSDVAIGKPVKVVVRSTLNAKGFVLPASSIVRAQSGLPVVWVKVEPERFGPYPVGYEPLDGNRVLVTSGLKPEQRVVTDGASLINQIR